jgi:hypothetical protein
MGDLVELGGPDKPLAIRRSCSGERAGRSPDAGRTAAKRKDLRRLWEERDGELLGWMLAGLIGLGLSAAPGASAQPRGERFTGRGGRAPATGTEQITRLRSA